MKKYVRVLATITFCFGIGVAAKAEMRDDIVMTLPFGFEAGEATLPAGTYKVSRISNDISGPLLLTSYDNGTSVFVLPTGREGTSEDKPHLTFQQVGAERFLNTIQTASETYCIPVSHSAVMEAAAKSHTSGEVSAASGNE